MGNHTPSPVATGLLCHLMDPGSAWHWRGSGEGHPTRTALVANQLSRTEVSSIFSSGTELRLPCRGLSVDLSAYPSAAVQFSQK